MDIKDNKTVNINGNASSIQIQQDVSNSVQAQKTNEDFDYCEVLKLLNEITKYEPLFGETFGQGANQALTALNNAKKAVINKEPPSRIKESLKILKDISLRVTSSLIATGILGLLSQIKF